MNEVVTLVHVERLRRETTHNVITSRQAEKNHTARPIWRSGWQMAVKSVDLDRRGFLYFSFVVCFGRAVEIGIIPVAIVSARLSDIGAGN